MSSVRGVKTLEVMRCSVTPGLLVGLLGVALLVSTRPVKAQSAVQGLRLYVMDGGSIIIDAPEKFGLTREQVKNSNMSCPVYLIVHPRGTLLFDTGLGDRYVGRPFNEAVLGDPPDLPAFVSLARTTWLSPS